LLEVNQHRAQKNRKRKKSNKKIVKKAMTERLCSSFKESRPRFNVLTPCFCLIPSQSTVRITCHSAGF